MKKPNNNTLLKALYNTHSASIICRNNKKYLKLFEHYTDVVANVSDEDLKSRILYCHINIEELLFNYILHTSKVFYELGFNDLKNLLLEDQNMD